MTGTIEKLLFPLSSTEVLGYCFYELAFLRSFVTDASGWLVCFERKNNQPPWHSDDYKDVLHKL